MWIWLILSLLLVIACSIFGIHSFKRSRTLQKFISRDPEYKRGNAEARDESGFPVIQQQNFSNLKMKFKSIEENSVLQVHQLNTLQKRIEALEEGSSKAEDDGKWNEEDEDWEKLYYASRREKEALESELYQTKEALDDTRGKLGELEKQQAGWVQMKSEMETRLHQAHSLQNTVEELRRKLEGAGNREKELTQQIEYEKYMHVKYELLKQQNSQLLSETDQLSSRLNEIDEHNNIMQEKIKRLAELGSSHKLSEYEKGEIKKGVDD